MTKYNWIHFYSFYLEMGKGEGQGVGGGGVEGEMNKKKSVHICLCRGGWGTFLISEKKKICD